MLEYAIHIPSQIVNESMKLKPVIIKTEGLKCKQFGSRKEKIIVTITSDNIYQHLPH